MSKLDEFRQKNPAYAKVPDAQLADALHRKYYANVPREQFDAMVGLKPSAPKDDSRARAVMIGARKGLENITRGILQIPGAEGAIDTVRGAMGNAPIREKLARVEAERANNTRTGYQTFGEVLGSTPVAALPGGPLVQGAVSGALLTNARDPGGVVKDAAIGAVGGVVGDRVVRGAQRAIAPKLSDAQRTLQKMGVTLTPGRAMGEGASRFEDRAGSVMGVGDLARRRAMESRAQFNRGIGNKVLEGLGAKLPEDMPAGRDMVDYVGQQIGARYNAVVPNVSARLDRQFLVRLDTLKKRAGLTAEAEDLFNREWQRIGVDAFDPSTGVASGKKMRQLTERLNNLASTYMRDQDPAKREVGVLLGDVREQIFQMAARTSPRAAKDLRAVNAAWAKFKRLQIASARATGEDGIFTPAQFQQAVKAADRSKDKARFSRNKALMQPEANAAVAVLPERIPDSGTAERIGQGAGLLAMAADPTGVGQGLLTIGALGALPYTRTGTRAAEALITRRPAGAQRLADLLTPLRPIAAVAAPALIARRD